MGGGKVAASLIAMHLIGYALIDPVTVCSRCLGRMTGSGGRPLIVGCGAGNRVRSVIRIRCRLALVRRRCGTISRAAGLGRGRRFRRRIRGGLLLGGACGIARTCSLGRGRSGQRVQFHAERSHGSHRHGSLSGVRRAIAYATDYKTIQEVIYPGTDMTGPLSTAFKDAHNDGIEPGVFDLEKAKEELAKSKYAGQKITLVNSYVASLAFEAEVALMMQANLEQIGITLDIKPEPWNRIVELSSKPETTPASTQVNISPSYPSPDAMFYNQYHSKASGTWMSMEWLQNPEIDALIDKARGETDISAQNAIYKEMQAKIADLQPDVWAVSPNRRYGANKCLRGYEFIPMQSWDLNFSNFHWDCKAD